MFIFIVGTLVRFVPTLHGFTSIKYKSADDYGCEATCALPRTHTTRLCTGTHLANAAAQALPRTGPCALALGPSSGCKGGV